MSNFTIEQLDEFKRHGPIQVQQVGYNMLDRRAESAMILRCAELGVGLMTYGALSHGLFSGISHENTVLPGDDWRSTGDVFGLRNDLVDGSKVLGGEGLVTACAFSSTSARPK